MTMDTKAFLDAVCRMLEEGASCVPVPVAGTSMTPFLYPGDTVYLSLPSHPLKRGDVALFVRPGGRYVLHRVIREEGSGFRMLGDSQTEAEYVEKSRIRAVAVQVVRRGERLQPGDWIWERFARGWTALVPVRGLILRTAGLFRRKAGKK